MQTVSFENGDEMPVLGLGTWKAAPGAVYEAVQTALDVGYRHIDCAPIYGNEAEVGQALSEAFTDGGVDRADVWVTSKLWNDAHAPEDVRPALEATLDDLQLDTLDLYLIHWPVAFEPGVGMPESPDELVSLEEMPLSETWEAMVDLRDEGLVRHLGVSNFNVHRLRSFLDTVDVAPEMNQVEMHPYLPQWDLLSFCQEHDIPVTAYSPLGSRDRPESMKAEDEPVLLDDPTVREIAERHDVSPAQVLIRWALERGTVTIPKSTTPAHIEDNLQAADLRLDDADIEAINELDRNRRYVTGEGWTGPDSPYSRASLWGE